MSVRAVPPEAGLPSGRLAVALRLPVFVAVAGLLGGAGHIAADHEIPPLRLFLLGLGLVAVSAAPLRRREVSTPLLTGLLLGAQAVLHLVLCLCHCVPGTTVGTFVHEVLCPGSATSGWATNSWAGDGWTANSWATGSSATSSWATDPLLVPSPGSGYLAHAYPGHTMLLAHLFAAVAAGWWLRRGEAAAWAAVRAVRPVLWATAPAPPAIAVRARPRVRPVVAVVGLRDQVLATAAHPRRGPPVAG